MLRQYKNFTMTLGQLLDRVPDKSLDVCTITEHISLKKRFIVILKMWTLKQGQHHDLSGQQLSQGILRQVTLSVEKWSIIIFSVYFIRIHIRYSNDINGEWQTKIIKWSFVTSRSNTISWATPSVVARHKQLSQGTRWWSPICVTQHA